MTPRFIRTPTGIIRYDNNFTDIEKTKLENIENGAQVNTILGIKGSNEDDFRIGYIIITKDDIDLGNVDNTGDSEKVVLSAFKLTNGRDITIGNQTVNFDGSEDIEYSLSKIGAVNKAGDTITGDIILSDGAGLTVDGAVLLKSTLSVDEKTILKDILEVSGATTLKDTLAVTGNTTIGGTISVTGNSTLSNLNITGNNTIGGTLNVTGNTTLNNELVSNGAVILKDTLDVTGNTNIGRDINIGGNSTLSGTLIVVGDSSLSTLTTSGLATLNELNVTKGANILGNAAINGGLAVKGNSSFSTISTSEKATLNSLEVVNALSIGSDLSISGALTIAGETTFNGATSINNTLDVSKAVKLKDTLAVTGNSTLSNLNITGNNTIGGTLNVTGNTTLNRLDTDLIMVHKIDVSGSYEDGEYAINVHHILHAAKIDADELDATTCDVEHLMVRNEAALHALEVTNDALIDNDLKVSHDLKVIGDTSIDTSLSVADIITTKNLTVSNTLACNGVVTLAKNKYDDKYNYGGMDAGNSNIYNVNQLQFGDLCDSSQEGIQFYNTATTVDSLWAKNGVLYFTSNRSLGTATYGSSNSDSIVLTSTNYTNYTVSSSGGIYSGPIILQWDSSPTMDNTTKNPRIIFRATDKTQAVAITYTCHDSYRASKGLKIMDIDGSDPSNVWLEVQGNMYSPKFVENGKSLSEKYLGITAKAESAKTLDYFVSNSSTTYSLEIDKNIIGYTSGLSNPNPAGGTATDGALIGQRYSDNWKAEIYIDYRTGHMATRGKNNGTWQSWLKQLDSGNFTDFAAAKSHEHDHITNSVMSVVAYSNNEINFGGTNTADKICFGYRATGSRPIPTDYYFGKNSGTFTSANIHTNITYATKINTPCIAYTGTKNTNVMIKFLDNTTDAYGNSIAIGGGGLTIIGSGESATTLSNSFATEISKGNELMMVAGDNDVDIYTNCNNGYSSSKKFSFTTDGYLSFQKGVGKGLKLYENSTDNYIPSATWLKDGVDYSATYAPQIGHHNTGGDGNGSISIVPYKFASSGGNPWDSKHGLYLYKGVMKLENGDGEVIAQKITSNLNTSSHIAGNKGTAIINSTAADDYVMLCRMKSKNGVFTMGKYLDCFRLYYTADSVISAGTNTVSSGVILMDESGNSYFSTIYEGNTALSSKYAAKSHIHNTLSHNYNSGGTIYTYNLYFENMNELNFGSTSNVLTTFYFGYRAKDSAKAIVDYYFGKPMTVSYTINGTTKSDSYAGSASVHANRIWCNSLQMNGVDITSIYDVGTVTNLGYTNDTEAKLKLITMRSIAYWNGKYNASYSNLQYCFGGQITYSTNATITNFRAGSTYLEVTANGIAYGCTWFQSDTKLKNNIAPTNVNNALDTLLNIDFIQYDWKESYMKNNKIRPHVNLGVSANQIETILPEAVMNIEQPEDSEYDVIKQLNTTVLVTYALKAIVELNNKLTDKVSKLENRIKELEKK